MKEFDRVRSDELIKLFAEEFEVSELFAELLVRRGFESSEAVRAFLSPSQNDMMDPLLLSGMKDAVSRIRTALENKERIVVYGDYDCDGIMATSLLYGYLQSVGADVYYHVPNRFEGGYGLNTETLENIAETLFPDLIITVDCGISSAEEAEYLSEVLAIDLIVTDHHTLPDILPNAIVIDPKLDPSTPCADLCGAGVALKLVEALAGRETALQYVDLAAIATIADIVPLRKENRIIASLGLKKINEHRMGKGLRMLIESCDREDHVSSEDIGFRIAPRINAVGRIADPNEIVRLFVSEEYLEIQGLIDKVGNANELRKSIQTQIYNEALDMLKEIDLSVHRIIVLYKESWNIGVIGLVAARLTREFNRPTILFGGEDVLKGSARSPEGIDIHRTIKAAESVLLTFGGHAGAAGLSLKRECLIEARNLMNDYLENTYPESLFIKRPAYDLTVSASDVTLRFAAELSRLEPTGEGNRKPLFRLNSDECSLVPMSNAQHAKGRLNDSTEVVAFGYSYLVDGISEGMRYDLIAECNAEVFRNRERVQMKVVGAFPAGYRSPSADPNGFHRYLRSNIYPESLPKFTAIRLNEINDCFYDERVCTLFVAFSSVTVEKVMAVPGFAEKISHVEYAKPADVVSNMLVIAPDFIPVAYKRIVLLDTPLTKGYISYLNKHTNADIYVVTDNYPFSDRIKAMDLSTSSVEKSYQAMRSFVFMGNGASGPMEFFKKTTATDIYQTIAHFYILFDCDAIKIEQGFALTIRQTHDLAASTLYRRLLALKNKL